MIRLVIPFALAMAWSAPLAAAASRPNVLFIALDDLRPELGCYGQAHIISPNIDRLAARGVVFTRAYCQYPVCNASRSSIMTGLRPDSTGVSDNRTQFRKIVPDVVTLPQQFKRYGYQTQAFGKIYHGLFEFANVGRTFDDPASWTAPHWYGSPQYYFSPRGMAVAREVYGKKAGQSGDGPDEWKKHFVQGLATEAPDVPDAALYDGELTDRAIRALGDLKGKPFFLAVGYLKPHLPFVAPKKYWDLYDRATIALPRPATAPKGAPVVALQNGNELRTQYIDMGGTEPLSEAQARELRHGYYACVSFVDVQIGRLLAELDRLGLRDNTIVVLWGDHGWHLGEQGLWAKLSDFEVAARVPLIVSAPGRKAGVKSAALVEFVDLFPSLCELAGLPQPGHLEGTSFVRLLDAPNRPWKSAAFTQVVHGATTGRSLRTERYRFTRWHPTKDPGTTEALELYDLGADTTELENIAGRPENAALVQEFSARLAKGWRGATP